MEIEFIIVYASIVVQEDIPKLSTTNTALIKSAIEEKLTTHPELFGKPLRTSLRGYRSLRVGEYRIIFKIDTKTCYILAILHRAVVYKKFPYRK